MPKVTMEIGKARLHCSPSQVQSVYAWLSAAAAASGDVTSLAGEGAEKESGGDRPWNAEAASAIIDVVDESHSFLARRVGRPLPDLRHGIVFFRHLVLQHEPPGPAKNVILANLKFLERQSVAAAEIRPWSQARLQEAAEKTEDRVQGFFFEDGAEIVAGKSTADGHIGLQIREMVRKDSVEESVAPSTKTETADSSVEESVVDSSVLPLVQSGEEKIGSWADGVDLLVEQQEQV